MLRILVLVMQILIEMALASALLPNIVVLTGLAFTSYRLWQLQSARASFSVAGAPVRTGRRLVGGVLWLGIIFWSCNLVFLLFVALPRAVEAA